MKLNQKENIQIKLDFAKLELKVVEEIMLVKTCSKCNKSISAWEDYKWTRRGEQKYYHKKCYIEKEEELEVEIRKLSTDDKEVEDVIVQPDEQYKINGDLSLSEKDFYERIQNSFKDGKLSTSSGNSEGDGQGQGQGDGKEEGEGQGKDKKEGEPTDQEMQEHFQVSERPLPNIPDDFEIPMIRHHKFTELLQYARMGFNVYLAGPPGSGKSKGCEELSRVFRIPFYPYYLSQFTSETKFLGFIDLQRELAITAFHLGWKDGGVINLEELDNTLPNLQGALNPFLESSEVLFPNNELIRKHTNCIIVASGNTVGLGGTPSFPERRAMDAAFRERFVLIEWDYDQVLEKLIVKHYMKNEKIANALLNAIWDARKFCMGTKDKVGMFPKFFVSPRVCRDLAKLLSISYNPFLKESIKAIGFNELAEKYIKGVMYRGASGEIYKAIRNLPIWNESWKIIKEEVINECKK